MLRMPCRLLMVLVWLCTWSLSATAQETATTAKASPAKETWSVATKEAPPFAMINADGKWTGLAVELFEEIAQDQNKEISWTGLETTKDVIDQVAAKKFDAGISAITITADREEILDFSHTYYNSGLAIAVSQDRTGRIWDVLKALASPAFLATVGTLATLLFTVGAIIWFVEHKHNSDQFEKDPVSGIGNGFWWSAVTMTTVGYGDKAPVTVVGRAIAVVWMFAALILTAVFTAQLTTSLTISGISGPVSSVDDLPSAQVGVVAKSASGTYFSQRYISVTTYDAVETGLVALANGEIDAFVHDEPILRFSVQRQFPHSVKLLSQVFEPQDYGVALPAGSPLREQVNQGLLEIRNSTRWDDIKSRYFGHSD